MLAVDGELERNGCLVGWIKVQYFIEQVFLDVFFGDQLFGEVRVILNFFIAQGFEADFHGRQGAGNRQ